MGKPLRRRGRLGVKCNNSRGRTHQLIGIYRRERGWNRGRDPQKKKISERARLAGEEDLKIGQVESAAGVTYKKGEWVQKKASRKKRGGVNEACC